MVITLEHQTTVFGTSHEAIMTYEALKQINQKVEIVEMPSIPTQIGMYIFKY